MPFTAYFRPQSLDESLINILQLSGLIQFSFGIQTGDDEFCNNVYHRQPLYKDYPRLCKTIASYGLNVSLQFTGGNPLATEKEFESTLAFISKLPFDASNKTSIGFVIADLMCVPGTQFLEEFPEILDMPRSLRD